MPLSTNFAKTLNTLVGKNAVSDWLLRRQRELLMEQISQEVAVRAMQRAGFDPLRHDFIPTDIGLVAYRTPESPKIMRYKPIMTDTRWLRPFVELAALRRLSLQIQIGILDSQGEAVFWEEKKTPLHEKTRFLTNNWLPLEGYYAGGRWSVVLYVNEQLAGLHRFEWVSIGENDILNQLHTDGEINEELQHAVRKGRFRKMTLDELLADQNEG